MTFDKDKNGTKSDKNVDKRNKTDNAKPDKADRPGAKLDLLFNDEDIILRSASIKPNNFRPRYVCKRGEGGAKKEKKARERVGRYERTKGLPGIFSLLSISQGSNPALIHRHSFLPLSLLYAA